MSDAARRCVIVGGGHAAAQLCASLRDAGWAGPITLVGNEPTVPYHRPPLSKTQLDPAAEPAVQAIRPAEFYAKQRVELRLGQTVRSIDREAGAVDVGHERLPYDVLVLATGSLNRRPPITGIEDPRVLSLRTAADAAAVRDRVREARRVAVIGGGFVGLEVASSLRKLGRDVTLLQMSDRVLSRVTSPPVSAYFEALHRGHGVDLRTGVSVTMIRVGGTGTGTGTGGRLTLLGDADAVVCEADLVVVGAGARANDDLARLAEIDVNNGVLVDDRNRTSDPAVYAVGDCCNQFHPTYQMRLRLESVQNAVDGAKAAAAAICGRPAPAPTLPWFWSDQYDVKLQIAGLATGYDRCVVRGDPTPGSPFSAWYLRDGRLIAVDAVNDPRSYVVASKLIPRAARPDPDALADVGRDLKTLL